MYAAEGDNDIPRLPKEEIVRMVMFAADMAAMDNHRGPGDTTAKMIHRAVTAAIECALENGLLIAAPDANFPNGITVRL